MKMIFKIKDNKGFSGEMSATLAFLPPNHGNYKKTIGFLSPISKTGRS